MADSELAFGIGDMVDGGGRRGVVAECFPNGLAWLPPLPRYRVVFPDGGGTYCDEHQMKLVRRAEPVAPVEGTATAAPAKGRKKAAAVESAD